MLFLLILFLIFGIAYTAYLPFQDMAKTWMDTLYKPAFLAPGWVFGVAWPVIYLLLAVSVWLVLKQKGNRPITPALWVFALQFFVNILWGPVIINMQNVNAATIYIFILFGLVIWNMIVFFKVSKLAGQLFIPYVAWLVYAACVQLSVWQHTPITLGS